MSTGTQAAAAGLHQGFAQIHSASAQMFDVIQHENPVFVDDAHADDGAQIGDDAQRGAGDQQRDDDAKHREHGAENDGDRCVEGTELQQRDGEDEDDGHDQHDHQVAETIPPVADKVRRIRCCRAGGAGSALMSLRISDMALPRSRPCRRAVTAMFWRMSSRCSSSSPGVSTMSAT